jgi:hypothetical protein
MPINIAGQGYPALLDLHLDPIRRHGSVPVEPVKHRVSDLVVAPSAREGKLDLDLFGHGLHPFHASNGCFSRSLLGEGLDMPGQSHDAVAGRYADVASRDARLPAQFGKHGLSEQFVIGHGVLS